LKAPNSDLPLDIDTRIFFIEVHLIYMFINGTVILLTDKYNKADTGGFFEPGISLAMQDGPIFTAATSIGNGLIYEDSAS
jgi:hypothetical protein